MTEPKQRFIVDGIEFAQIFPFLRIVRSATSAMQPPRLVVALLMVVTLIAVGRVWDAATEATVDRTGLLLLEGHPTVDASALDANAPSALPARMDPFEATAAHLRASVNHATRGVLFLRPQMIYEAGRNLFFELPTQLWTTNRAFAFGYGLFALLVAAIGGGALCRMAGCDIAGQERLRVFEAIDFVLSRWVRFVLTLLLPVLMAVGLALVLIAFGLLLTSFLDVLGGPLYVVALLAGFLLVFLLVGYAVGFTMLIPAAACENCDPADAQQRAYAYVLNRPLHLLGYTAVGLVVFALGYVLVCFIVATVLNFTAALTGVLTSNPALTVAGGFEVFSLAPSGEVVADGPWHVHWAAWWIGLWQVILVDLVAAYVVSFFFTASTTLYLLMRRACDGQHIEEVWRRGMTKGTMVPTLRVDE